MWFVSNVPQQSRFFVSEIFRIQVTFEQESLVFRETEENVSQKKKDAKECKKKIYLQIMCDRYPFSTPIFLLKETMSRHFLPQYVCLKRQCHEISYPWLCFMILAHL